MCRPILRVDPARGVSTPRIETTTGKLWNQHRKATPYPSPNGPLP